MCAQHCRNGTCHRNGSAVELLRRRALVCVAIATLTACGGRAWTPEDPSGLQALRVESTSRLGSVQTMRFGDYRVDSVHVSWARGGGDGVRLGGVGADASRARQFYRFVLHSPDGARLAAECESSAQWRDVGIGSISVSASARYSLECNIRRSDGGAWKLGLREDGDRGFEGVLSADTVSIDVSTTLAGNRMFGRQPHSHELRQSGRTVLAVDRRSRTVWLAQPAPDTTAHHAAVAAGVALLLYHRPSQ